MSEGPSRRRFNNARTMENLTGEMPGSRGYVSRRVGMSQNVYDVNNSSSVKKMFTMFFTFFVLIIGLVAGSSRPGNAAPFIAAMQNLDNSTISTSAVQPADPLAFANMTFQNTLVENRSVALDVMSTFAKETNGKNIFSNGGISQLMPNNSPNKTLLANSNGLALNNTRFANLPNAYMNLGGLGGSRVEIKNENTGEVSIYNGDIKAQQETALEILKKKNIGADIATLASERCTQQHIEKMAAQEAELCNSFRRAPDFCYSSNKKRIIGSELLAVCTNRAIDSCISMARKSAEAALALNSLEQTAASALKRVENKKNVEHKMELNAAQSRLANEIAQNATKVKVAEKKLLSEIQNATDAAKHNRNMQMLQANATAQEKLAKAQTNLTQAQIKLAEVTYKAAAIPENKGGLGPRFLWAHMNQYGFFSMAGLVVHRINYKVASRVFGAMFAMSCWLSYKGYKQPYVYVIGWTVHGLFMLMAAPFQIIGGIYSILFMMGNAKKLKISNDSAINNASQNAVTPESARQLTSGQRTIPNMFKAARAIENRGRRIRQAVIGNGPTINNVD